MLDIDEKYSDYIEEVTSGTLDLGAYFSIDEITKAVWDYQQKKIEILRHDNEELNVSNLILDNNVKVSSELLYYRDQWREIAGAANLKNLVKTVKDADKIIKGIVNLMEPLNDHKYLAVCELVEDMKEYTDAVKYLEKRGIN